MAPKRKLSAKVNIPATFDSAGNAARLHAYLTLGAIALSHKISSRRAESDMHPVWNYVTASFCGKHLGRVINVPQFRVWLRSDKDGRLIVNVPLSAASNKTTPLTRDQLERIPDWIIMLAVDSTDAYDEGTTLADLISSAENDLVQPYFSVIVDAIYVPLVMEIKPMVTRSHRDIIYYVRQLVNGLSAAQEQVDEQADIILVRKKYMVLLGSKGQPEILEYACCGQYYHVRLREPMAETMDIIPVAEMAWEEVAYRPGKATGPRRPGSSASQRGDEPESDSDSDPGEDLADGGEGYESGNESDEERLDYRAPALPERQEQAQARDERHDARDEEADARDERAREEAEFIRRAGPNPADWTKEMLEEAYARINTKSKVPFFQKQVKSRASITKLLRAGWSGVICLGSPVSNDFEAYTRTRIDELAEKHQNW